MNCIFICVFAQEKYVDMFFLLMESLVLYGNVGETAVLVYTSTPFMHKMKQNPFCEKVLFETNDSYATIEKACKARLDFFKFKTKYEKILYLDTDILVKDDVGKVFAVCKEDLLYVLEEGKLTDADGFYGGQTLFGAEMNNYADQTAFTSGILLFPNSSTIQELFDRILADMQARPSNLCCMDQPYIVYNAFKYNLFNNKILKTLVVNNDFNVGSDKVIHHFPGGIGKSENKIKVMTCFLNRLQRKPYFRMALVALAILVLAKE
jgi:lipopolysaccharide biosynthesis glycosyltransferase